MPILLLGGSISSFGWWTHVNLKRDQASLKLVQAVLEGKERDVKGLLSEGADPDMRVNLPAHPRNAWERFRKLLSPGNEDAKRGTGPTLLLASLQMERFEIAGSLIESGADPNRTDSDGQTPLHWAIGNPRIVRLLLEHGARADAFALDFMTPLTIAVIGDDSDSARLLLAHGADPEAVPPEMEMVDPRAFAHIAPPSSHSSPADPRSPSSGGNPPWMSSAGLTTSEGGQPASKLTIEQLMALSTFSTPLTHAVTRGRPRIIQLLIDAGARLPKDSEGRYDLIYRACTSGNVEIVRLLLDNGIDADTTAPSGGVTPLMYCSGTGMEPDILRLLIERGASTERRDSRFKWRPLDWAVHGETLHRKDFNTRWPPRLHLQTARHMDNRSPSDPVAVSYFKQWGTMPTSRRTYFAEDKSILLKLSKRPANAAKKRGATNPKERRQKMGTD